MAHSWYLGIDFSASGIAAILYDCQQNRSHPLYWSQSEKLGNSTESPIFLLPLELPRKKPETDKENLSSAKAIAPIPSYFQQAIPCYNRQSRQWEPQFANPDKNVVSLYQLQQSLQALLATLLPGQSALYRVGAVELSEYNLKAALSGLEGIIVNCSAAWGDTYRFNLREAILGAQLIETPDRIFFLEETIAIGLSFTSHPSPVTRHELSVTRSQQGQLILQGGMITTELALVEDRPLAGLSRENWALRGVEYGEIDLYYDIFFQLLYPQWLPEQKFLQNLKLEIPQAGVSDRPKRDRATVALENFSEGQYLLETAKRTLLILQKQEAFTTHLGYQEWGVTRSQLEEKILLPLYEQLNRQINELLSQKGWQPDAIARVFCSGEMLALLLPFGQSWLSRKFPQAAIVSLQNNNNSTLIAEGLSRLPLFPQMLDRLHHQYSDYFLLAELLRNLGDRSLTVEEMSKSLEHRGIPRACLWRILPFLSGQLPQGFIPSPQARVRMTAKSRAFLPYSAIASAPLFSSQSPLYSPNVKQRKRLQQYLAFLLATTVQKLQDPLAIDFVAEFEL
jgi:hypothetical protein